MAARVARVRNRAPDRRIPCPVCGKRIMDWQGPEPGTWFSIELRCPGDCGLVTVTAGYIKKCLQSPGVLRKII